MHKIVVNVLDALSMKETEIMGKQDPYVEVRTNYESKSTVVRYDAGKNASICFRFYSGVGWREEIRLMSKDLYGVIDFRM